MTREPKGGGNDDETVHVHAFKRRGCTSGPVLLEAVNFSRRASLHPSVISPRGENFGKSISTRRSYVAAATFRRVSGFTVKLSRFSRAATKESGIYIGRSTIPEINSSSEFCNEILKSII